MSFGPSFCPPILEHQSAGCEREKMKVHPAMLLKTRGVVGQFVTYPVMSMKTNDFFYFPRCY